MAHPNEELTRRAYDAFSKGDVDTLRQVFADNAVFHEPGRNPVSGDYKGIDQILAFFGTLAERSGGTFRVNLHDVVANDEHAVGLHVAEGGRGAVSTARRRLCCMCGMAGSPKPGRTITTRMHPMSSGRRSLIER
jgi:ketosteroid isomerase-like protein